MPETTVHVTTNAITWGIVAKDGTLYATRALLAAASKMAWPDLDPGVQPTSVEISSENGSGAAGSPFYFARNQGADFEALSTGAARDNVADLNYGAGQKEILAGVNPSRGHFQTTFNIWVRKTTGADEVIIKAIY